jgi:hypothetical protein
MTETKIPNLKTKASCKQNYRITITAQSKCGTMTKECHAKYTTSQEYMGV